MAKPIRTIRAQCRFCGASMWAQEDNPEPTCEACDALEYEMLRESHEIEETFDAIAHTSREMEFQEKRESNL